MNVAVYGNDARVNITAASASGSGAHRVNAEGFYVEANRIEAVWPALREELARLTFLSRSWTICTEPF